MTVFAPAPGRPARARSTAPPDKSISHRAALFGAMTSTPVRDHATTSTPTDTNSTLAAVAGARRASSSARGDELRDPRRRACAARGAADRADRRRQRRHADAAAAGLARRPGRRRAGRSTATSRSAAGRSTASPSRCALMGARDRGARGPLRRRSRSTARALRGIEYELPVASAQVKSCVLLAGLLADGRDDASSSRRRAATTPSGCCRRRRAPSSATAARVTVAARSDELELDDDRRPRRPLLGRLPSRPRRCSCPARGIVLAGRRRQLDAHRLPADRRAHGRGRGRAARGAADASRPASRSPSSTSRDGAAASARSSRPTRCRWRSTSCRWSRCSAASPRARRSCAAPRSCASRSPTGSRPSSTACAASAPTSRRPTDGFACAAPAACAAARIDAHGDHRLAMLGAVAGLASREGVEVDGHGGRRRLLPRLRRRPRSASLG